MRYTPYLSNASSRWIAMSLLGVLLAAVGGPLVSVVAAPLAATAPTLGAAATYSVLGSTTVTNTGATIVPGDLGVNPGSAITGFPPGIVGPPGMIHATDVSAATAQSANTTAFNALDQPCTTTYPGAKDLVGATLVAGVYCADSFQLSGTLTLSGSGVWIFKSASDLTTSGSANVLGGNPCNVWWREVSSATLGTNTSLKGNVLASASISLQTGAQLDGRALAQTGAVTLDTNSFTSPPCAAPNAPTATSTSLPTASSTPTLAASSTSIAAATSTSIATATSTPLPTATKKPVPNRTKTPVPTPLESTATPLESTATPPPVSAAPTPPEGATPPPDMTAMPPDTLAPTPPASTATPPDTLAPTPPASTATPPLIRRLPPTGDSPRFPAAFLLAAVLIAWGIGMAMVRLSRRQR